MRRRFLLPILALTLAFPGTAGANHLHSGRPDCRTKKAATPAGTFPLAEVSVHGFGGFQMLDTPFPAAGGVTPAPRYGDNWQGEETLLEGDVIGASVYVNMIGVLGGGKTVVRPPGEAIRTFEGAHEFEAAAFTGHVKISKKTYECESVVQSNTIVRNLYYEVWLTGYLTPQPQSPLKTYGQAASVTITPGDVESR